MSTFSSIIFDEDGRCPDCGKIVCTDENGMPGLSCWAKKLPPMPIPVAKDGLPGIAIYDEVNKEIEYLWHFDPYGNLITTSGAKTYSSGMDTSAKCLGVEVAEAAE